MISYDIIEHGKPLQKVLKETPKPQGTEVLVRVTRAGVCHSDLHIWDGYFDWGGGKRFYVKERGCVPPFTLGHEPFGVVESVKAASDMYSPVSGEVIESNAKLADDLGKLSDDPFGAGWLIKVKVADRHLPAELMDRTGYEKHWSTRSH